MATISTNTTLDAASRSAGETMSITSGAQLKIHTDTRWHANSPASMTGSMGAYTITQGEVLIDASATRWLAFDTGSSTVPAIGTSVTQGGVSASYLLGVYASLTSAPTAVGAAMPLTGFLKFREVTGTFAAGALTGIGANATGADVAGWIEVVADVAAGTTMTVPRLGKWTHRGDWFYLDNTTGSVAQVLQVPTNGGGSGTHCPGVWIETSVGSGTYEFWPALASTAGWSVSNLSMNLGATDDRQKFVKTTGDGQMQIGENVTQSSTYTWAANVVTVTFASHGLAIGQKVDVTFTSGGGTPNGVYTVASVPTASTYTFALTGSGTAGNLDAKFTIGKVPVSGLKTRVPNIFMRQCATGTRATNAAPSGTIANRPEFATTTAGAIDVEYAYGDWYWLLSQAYSVSLKYWAGFDTLNIQECATSVTLLDGGCGMYGSLDVRALQLTSCFAGGTVTNWNAPRGNAPGATDHSIEVLQCKSIDFTNVKSGIVGFARNTGYPFSVNQSDSITFTSCTSFNGPLSFTTCTNCQVDDHDHCDRYTGMTNATTGVYAVQVITKSDNVLVDGLTFGLGGTITECHPYLGLFLATASSNVRFRNAGSRTSILSGGTSSPAYVFVSGGNNDGVKVQRCYLQPTRTGVLSTINTDTNMIYENVFGDYADTSVIASLNSAVKGIAGTNTTTGQASVYGTHFIDCITSDITGRYVLACNEPTTETSTYVTLTGTAAFNSSGGLLMGTIGDTAIIEDEYFRKGYTAFENSTPTMSGGTASNYTIEYDIDVNDGNGFTGSWTALTGANLNAETISPSDGFRLKIRFTTTSTNTTAITYYRINMTTTAVAQENLYTMDPVDATYTLTGLDLGTEVVLFDSSNVELKRQTLDIYSPDFVYSYTWDEVDITGCYVLIWKSDRIPIKITGITLSDESVSVPIFQSDDLVYSAPASTISTFNSGSKLQILDSGVTTAPVPQLYSEWKDWILVGSNAQYDFAYSAIGGNTIAGSKSIPKYAFQENGWKIRPDEANHTLNVTEGIIVGESSADPFVDTLGAYTVRINYEQPVQAISVTTSGSSLTAAEVWGYVSRKLTSVGISEIQNGLALDADIQDIKGTGFDSSKDNLVQIRKKAQDAADLSA